MITMHMEFIEMTGTMLFRMTEEDGGPSQPDLEEVGVREDSIVRVNRQGDIELRKPDGWDLIGGLLGDFDARVREATGLNWL